MKFDFPSVESIKNGAVCCGEPMEPEVTKRRRTFVLLRADNGCPVGILLPGHHICPVYLHEDRRWFLYDERCYPLTASNIANVSQLLTDMCEDPNHVKRIVKPKVKSDFTSPPDVEK
jgi:hypothetical protein